MTSSESDFLLPYTKHCFDLMNRPGCTYRVEQTIPHSPLLFGTPDFIAMEGNTLHVVDLKTGAGVMVDPEENDQAMAYAYMVLSRWHTMRGALDFDGVVLTIVQPTDEEHPVKSWTATREHVMAWGERAEKIMADTVAGNVHEYVPGEHCRWCKAKPVCPRLTGALATLPASMQPAELGALATAEILDRADLVLQFIDAVRAHGHDLASRGVHVPGWTLKPKRAMRTWDNPEEVLAWARRHRFVTDMTEPKLLSPAQVEKHDKALYEKVAGHVVSISSGTNLVRGNSPAPVALPPGASTIERLMANFETLKYRK
jgi:hypothetical protein